MDLQGLYQGRQAGENEDRPYIKELAAGRLPEHPAGQILGKTEPWVAEAIQASGPMGSETDIKGPRGFHIRKTKHGLFAIPGRLSLLNLPYAPADLQPHGG